MMRSIHHDLDNMMYKITYLRKNSHSKAYVVQRYKQVAFCLERLLSPLFREMHCAESRANHVKLPHICNQILLLLIS